MQFLSNLFGGQTEEPAKVQDQPKTLIEILIQNLSGKFPARSHKNVHASDLTKEGFCPRQTALLDIVGGKKKDEYQETAQTATYDVGNAVSDLVREKWLGDRAYGDWCCLTCLGLVPFSTRPEICPHCAGSMFRYEEVRFVSKTYDFSGGIDVLVNTGAPKLKVVELKIMAPDQFEKLVAPLSEHRIRTSLYLKLIEDSDHPNRADVDVTSGTVLYVSRAWGKKHAHYGQVLPFKEYDVVRDDSQLVEPLEKARLVKRWRDKKIIPLGVCPTSFCPKAKGCSVVKECWSGKFPGMAP